MQTKQTNEFMIAHTVNTFITHQKYQENILFIYDLTGETVHKRHGIFINPPIWCKYANEVN